MPIDLDLASGSVRIDGRDVDDVDVTPEGDLLAFVNDLSDLGGNTGKDVPSGLVVTIRSSDGFNTYLFHEAKIEAGTEGTALTLIHHHPNKYWEGRYGLATFLSAVCDQLNTRPHLRVREMELEDDWKHLAIERKIGSHEGLVDAVTSLASELAGTIREAEIALGGMTWSESYESNERLFCTEVILPLLRRMGFLDVRYTQGVREYGKDFTFSEATPFGSLLRHYGLQAKAGDVRGNVQGDVDELLGQLEDAFKMPFYELGSDEPRYISTFIIAISGSFTQNAREKIANKIPKGVFGSVYFLDRDRILDLVERYWRK